MKIKTSYVRVKENVADTFKHGSDAAQEINIIAASAGYSSVPEGEDNQHIINFLENQIAKCDESIREKLYIKTITEEIEE